MDRVMFTHEYANETDRVTTQIGATTGNVANHLSLLWCVLSVVVCTPCCDLGSMSSILIGQPKVNYASLG